MRIPYLLQEKLKFKKKKENLFSIPVSSQSVLCLCLFNNNFKLVKEVKHKVINSSQNKENIHTPWISYLIYLCFILFYTYTCGKRRKIANSSKTYHSYMNKKNWNLCLRSLSYYYKTQRSSMLWLGNFLL